MFLPKEDKKQGHGMKRVCIFTSVFPEPFDHRLFYKQAQTLVEAGYEVTFIVQHDKNEVVDGVKIVALPKPRNRLSRMMLTSWRVFGLALKEKADVYHFHDPEQLPWGWLLHKVTHKPVIYDLHENYADVILFKAWIPRFLRKPTAWITDRLQTVLAGRLSAIITATEAWKDKFSRSPAFCVSVCNFPRLDMVARTSETKSHEGRDLQYSIIYMGPATRERGFEIVIDALDLVVRQSPRVTCAILGHTKNLAWLDKERSSVMEKLIKHGNLEIVGRVPHTEVFRYLHASAIAWRPRLPYQHTIDVTVFEYMAAGKPIVASDVPLHADIIRETRCGIVVNPYDVEAHASAILYLLQHPEEAQQMGSNGRRAVLDKYNWENESKKLLKLYEELTKRFPFGS